MKAEVISLVEENLKCRILGFEKIGRGASAEVYKVIVDLPQGVIAVKVCKNTKLAFDEYERINFISSRVDCKLPKLYFVAKSGDCGVLAMQFFEGREASAKSLLFMLKPNKEKLANEIIDNLIKIHSVHSDKFGPVENAVYDTWLDYYGKFANKIADFSQKSDVPNIVKEAVCEGLNSLPKLLGGNTGEPTLIHGDYWMPNFIINPQKGKLVGVVDPFNVMWAEPEYELFGLTVGCGKRLQLYDIYKNKVKTSFYCDAKLELYALFNELYWYKTLGKIDFGYLKYRSRRLLKELAKIN
ncbi:MAG: aminoglycoside phosphotransferase family protein [Anaerotruncus sp.]|nr:aminoglycoside phosphotransferase family protein [Anaerotruncus sp.]